MHQPCFTESLSQKRWTSCKNSQVPVWELHLGKGLTKFQPSLSLSSYTHTLHTAASMLAGLHCLTTKLCRDAELQKTSGIPVSSWSSGSSPQHSHTSRSPGSPTHTSYLLPGKFTAQLNNLEFLKPPNSIILASQHTKVDGKNNTKAHEAQLTKTTPKAQLATNSLVNQQGTTWTPWWDTIFTYFPLLKYFFESFISHLVVKTIKLFYAH